MADKSQENKQKTGRLVVRNLSFKCSESNLKEVFSEYGAITEVRVPRSPKNPRQSRGFGFVQFEKVKSAAAALEAMNGQKIMGRPVAVDWSLPKEKFLEASKKQAGLNPPKADKPRKSTKSQSSMSSESESGSDDDDSDDADEEDSEEGDSDEDDDDDSEESDSEDQTKATTSKKQPTSNTSKPKPTAQPAKKNEESSSDEESDSGNEDDGESESSSDEEEEMETKAGKKQDSDSGSISDEEASSEEGDSDSNSDDDGDDDDDDDDDSSDEDSEEGDSSKNKEPSRPSDVGEGKTLFIRNVPYESTNADLRAVFEKFGQLEVCKIVMDRDTEHSKGSAFVKYASKEEAEICLRKAQTQDEQFTLDGRRLEVSMALPRNDIEEMRKALKKQEKSVNKDKRNLYLLREGLVREGTQAAKGVSETDMAKRTKIESIKRLKLRNINIFVSPTRMVVHNLPKAITDGKLKKMFFEAAGDKKAKVSEARVMRNMRNPNSIGKCMSLGFAFVAFTEHEHALTALRHVNNNATYFGEDKRPIVGFSLENKTVLEAKMKRQGKAQNKAGQKSEERDRAVTNQAEVAKKTHIASLGKDKLHTAPKTKIRKGLPSHMGPKKRWRDKGKVAPPKKEKTRVSRAQKMQHQEPKEPQKRMLKQMESSKSPKRRRMNKEKREEASFNKLVTQYKNKLFSSEERTSTQQKQPKSKWFDES